MPALADLIARDELGLSVIVGDPGALSVGVSRGYVTDLLDPGRYLNTGDLVLTSCLWYRTDDDCPRFVDTLRRSGAIGVVAGLAGLTPAGVMPDALVAACRETGFTLLTLRAESSFAPICETILLERVTSDDRLAQRVNHFHRELVSAIRGGGPRDAMDMFTREFALPCWLLTARGVIASRHSSLADSPTPTESPTDQDIAAIRGVCVEPDDGPVLVECDWGTSQVWQIPRLGAEGTSPVEGPAISGSSPVAAALVIRVEGLQCVPEFTHVVSALRRVVGLELELSRRHHQERSRVLTELVDLLDEDWAAPGEVSAYLRLLGADPNLATLVIATAGRMVFGVDEFLDATLSRVLPDAVVISCPSGENVVTFVNGNDVDAARASEALRQGFAGNVPGEVLHVGVSDPVITVSGVSDGLRLARSRMTTAISYAKELAVVHGHTLDSYDALIEAVPLANRLQFSTDLLQSLHSYDANHGSDLVATLASFLDTCGSWRRSAEELQVHVNTLRYRIQRIEELTGRDLSAMADRVDLFLALHCTE